MFVDLHKHIEEALSFILFARLIIFGGGLFIQSCFKQEEELAQCQGSDLYKENVKHLATGIAKLKTREGQKTIQVSKDKQKITDGTRTCWYGGTRDPSGLPHGEGMLKYEDTGDVFTGTFNHGVLDREGKLSVSLENYKYLSASSV